MKQLETGRRSRGKASPSKRLALDGGPTGEDVLRNRMQKKSDFLRSGERLEIAPRVGKRGIQSYSAAAEKEHRYQGVRAMKAESASHNHSQLVVKAFYDTVGEFGFNIGEDAVFVTLYGPCDFDKRSELGARRPGEPTGNLGSCRCEGRFIVNSGEGFFEQIGAVKRDVVFLYGAELVPLLGAQVPGVFEERVSGFLDGRSLVRVAGFLNQGNLFTAHLVDCLGDELEDMKAVKYDLHVRCLGLDGFDESSGHIDSSKFKRFCSLNTKLVEEGVEGAGVLSLSGPDDAFLIVVDDSGDVAMSLSEAEFISADALQAVETVGIEIVFDDTLDDIAYRTPGNPHNLRDLGFVGDLHKIRSHLLERFGKTTVGSCPRHLLDADSAGRTLYSSRSVFKNESDRAETEMNPSNGVFAAVISGADPFALRTSRAFPRRFYGTDNNGGVFDNGPLDHYFCHNKSGNIDDDSGKTVEAHGFLLFGFSQIPEWEKPCAF